MLLKRNLLTILLFAIVSIISFWYYDNYLDARDPPILKADNSPTRIRPEIDSSISENHNLIYDNIRSRNYNTKSVKLLPEPEKPLSIPSPESDDQKDIIGDIVENISLASKLDEPSVTDTKKSLEVIRTENDQIIRNKTKKIRLHYYIQIASARSQAGAQKEWTRISGTQKKLLSNLGHKVERYKVSNKGYYYRLLIGPLRGNEHAKLLCKKLIQSRQNCIIKKM